MLNVPIHMTHENEQGRLIQSNLKTFERQEYASTPSIKMVLSGQENYVINGESYCLRKGQYLILDQQDWVETYVDSPSPVKGICIFPSKHLLNQVAAHLGRSLTSQLDAPEANDDLPLIHDTYDWEENLTGHFIKKNLPFLRLAQEEGTIIDYDQFYLKLAESMVSDQLTLQGRFKKMTAEKRSTHEELYRRVGRVKSFLRENFDQCIRLDDMAQIATLSKYHFARTFKALYERTPYQYLLQLRLSKARELLALDYSYEETSASVGFSDGKNLRKALKKQEDLQH